MLTIKGVKGPKLETYTTTKRYLIKNNIDTSRVVYYKNLNSYVYAAKKRYLSIPNAMFFDKDGNFVDYRKNPSDCNAKVEGFIEELSAFKEAKKDSTKTLFELKKLLASSNNKALNEEPADVTVFITWARYVGTLNKEKAFDWVKLLEEAKQKGVSVNYYLLNSDFQENWNMTKEQKEDLGLN
ncbi:hypothetical protein Q767_08305 [Flavobacterium enshiense DK69]|uniref:Uncharacterized protein n=1 Tax=Flavobacterium enshiense DK69 TaxID=1107311 RepID=A0A0A2MXV0_9FLAO|nr:hypothetical protein Q767_08305 [Flavobacterium enshiense DK69]